MNNPYSSVTHYDGDAESEKVNNDLLSVQNINGYHILDVISDKGNESIVYKVMKVGETFALKLYKRSVKVSENRMELLKQLDSPYVAQLIDYGYYNDYLYEIYKYYERGSLSNKDNINKRNIKKYIYQLNEGLHALHNASDSAMLIHGDLKPSNIFVSEDLESVIIGDFGISMLVEDDSFSIGGISGTPEFSPPSVGIGDQVRKTAAFDYGSLGLVIYFMQCGYSKFSGMTTAEITKEWSKGITLDEIIDSRLKALLTGLLTFDEDNRFGYENVKAWYEGSFVTELTPKSIYNKRNLDEKGSLWFGIFDNESITVTSVKELVVQMKKHWDQATFKLRDENLYAFLNKFNKYREKIPEIKRIVAEEDIDSAVFKTIYMLTDDTEIIYKGINFGDAENFIQTVASESKESALAEEVLVNGLFYYYTQQMGYPEEKTQKIKEILSLNSCPEKFKLYALTYIFAKKKMYRNYESLNALRQDVCNMTLEEIDILANDLKFIAWLYAADFKKEALSLLNSRSE